MLLHSPPLKRFCRAASAPLRFARAQLRWWGWISAVAACWLPAPPAAAEEIGLPFCAAPRDLLLESLAAELDERLVVSLIGPDGRLVEFTASASGTWTLITTKPGGESCMESGGWGFRLWPLAGRS